MTNSPRRRFWLKLAAGLLFAVLAYGGAYAALLRPLPEPCGNRITPTYVPSYAIPGPLPTFFRPAHLVDSKIRPRYWDIRHD